MADLSVVVDGHVDGCLSDGICLDEEQAVWMADAGSDRVSRVFEGG